MGKDTLFNILSMKRIPCILLLFAFMMAGTSSLFAQTALEGERSTIFDALQRSGLGKGEVVINQSAAIREMVGERMRGANVETTDSLTFLKVQGIVRRYFPVITNGSRKTRLFVRRRKSRSFFQRSRRMSLTTPRFGSCVWEISARMRRPII